MLDGSFKISFDDAAKGNLGLASFEGVVRNSNRAILIIFWGNIGTSTNNMLDLEGIINGISWALQ